MVLFHLSSSGQVEQMVRLTKEAPEKKGLADWQYQVMEFLLIQHITPNTTIGCSPVELLMGC